jgi:acyl carrier protein
MELNSIKEKIREFVLRNVFSGQNEIHDSTLVFKEGYFDSMGFVMLITFIEEEFSLKTNDTDLIEENFESINAIADFVVRKSA